MLERASAGGSSTLTLLPSRGTSRRDTTDILSWDEFCEEADLLFKELVDHFERQLPTHQLSHSLRGLANIAGAMQLRDCLRDFEESPSAAGLSAMKKLLALPPRAESSCPPVGPPGVAASLPFEAPLGLAGVAASLPDEASLGPAGVAAPLLTATTRVLIADDTRVGRSMLKRSLLKAAGGQAWQIEEASQAQEALDMASSDPFDIIALDENYVGEELLGSEIARHIREMERNDPSRKRALLISFSGDNLEDQASSLTGGFDLAWPKGRGLQTGIDQLVCLLRRQA